MKNILLIAGLGERYYFDPFIAACKNPNIRMHVCDPSLFPQNARLHVHQNEAGNISGYIDTILVRGNGESTRCVLPLSEIHAAWYLRENYEPSAPRRPDDLASRFTRNETRQALRALFSLLPCAWVNKQDAIEKLNSNKLYQQALAARCGLQTPRTVISNSPDDVMRFSEPRGGLLLKSMGYIRLEAENRLALYSERFSHGEVAASEAAIRCCPVYAQEYVEKRYEYRVMVIGSRVLSCRIDSQASQVTAVDWRHYDFDRVEHRYVDLPLEVQQKLLNFMTVADLRFGAIDLIENSNGEFVFLEVNPSGQWGWIADIGGVPVVSAVAHLLETI